MVVKRNITPFWVFTIYCRILLFFQHIYRVTEWNRPLSRRIWSCTNFFFLIFSINIVGYVLFVKVILWNPIEFNLQDASKKIVDVQMFYLDLGRNSNRSINLYCSPGSTNGADAFDHIRSTLHRLQDIYRRDVKTGPLSYCFPRCLRRTGEETVTVGVGSSCNDGRFTVSITCSEFQVRGQFLSSSLFDCKLKVSLKIKHFRGVVFGKLFFASIFMDT